MTGDYELIGPGPFAELWEVIDEHPSGLCLVELPDTKERRVAQRQADQTLALMPKEDSPP